MTITHHFSLFLLLDSQVVPQGKNKPPYDKYTGTPTMFKDYKSSIKLLIGVPIRRAPSLWGGEVAQKGFKWLAMASNGSKWFQRAPNGLKWLQMVPNSSKWLNMALNGAKWIQINPNSSN